MWRFIYIYIYILNMIFAYLHDSSFSIYDLGNTTLVATFFLLGGLNPSEKYESQMGWLFPIYGKIKNVPNHQPVFVTFSETLPHPEGLTPWLDRRSLPRLLSRSVGSWFLTSVSRVTPVLRFSAPVAGDFRVGGVARCLVLEDVPPFSL